MAGARSVPCNPFAPFARLSSRAAQRRHGPCWNFSAMKLPFAASLLSLAMSAVAQSPEFAVTIYSSAAPGSMNVAALAGGYANMPGYALVSDRRRLNLPNGRGELRFVDVAKRIDPTTVSFASVDDPQGTRVLEQNFQFDLVSAAKLRERYIGEQVSVEQVQGDRVERFTGKLMSAADPVIVLLDSGEVLTLNRSDNIRFAALPGGLITRPTLVWLLDSKRGGEQLAQVSYQTQGMTWWADYNVTLDESGGACKMDLSAWVTIVNQSGLSYPQTKLKLVAGEVNRAPAAPAGKMMMARSAEINEAASDSFEESQLFEYHLYTLGRPSDLPDNSTKQLELFPAAIGSPCKKQLIFTAVENQGFYYGQPVQDQGYYATSKGNTGAYLEFVNRKENGLGIPLPAGRVRVNQASKDGSLEFIGEDVIDHTPRNETLKLKLGDAFDIAGERRQTDFKVDTAAKTIDESFEISVRNRKTEAVEVTVREYLYRWTQWALTDQSQPSVKRDAQTIDFPLRIPADGEAKVRYTVRYTW
jgi:hypothetical protein